MAFRDDQNRERFEKSRQRDEAYKKQLPGEDDPPLPQPVEPIHAQSTPGRNDPCPCGSGKKYKQCCGRGGKSGKK